MGIEGETKDVGILITQFVTVSDLEYESYSRFSQLIAQLLVDDELSLLEFIQKLGDKLTSTDNDERSKSIHCLSETLYELNQGNKSKLSRQDVNVLVEFYLNKFDDQYCFKYVIQGLNSLVNFKGFGPRVNDNLQKLLSKVIESYDSAKFLAKVRYEVFKLIESLFEFKEIFETDKTLANIYTKAFIQVSSGEKDPRNLLISFKVNRLINSHLSFDITNEVEKNFINELFDNCFCYFPISFTPPPNDPYKISATDLKLALRETLTSQDLFANDLYNNLFEKLTSTNPVIRNDVLLTILSSVQCFSVDTITEYWQKIWNNLKYEILHLDNLKMFKPNENFFIPNEFLQYPDTDDTKSLFLTLEILNQLILKLNSADFCLESITTDLKDNLSVNNKYFKQGIIILGSLSSTSEYSFNYIMKYIFRKEHLGKFISATSEGDDGKESELQSSDLDSSEDVAMTINKQRDLIDSFGYVFTSYQILSQSLPKDSTFYSKNHLNEIKDHVVIFLGQLLQLSSNIEKTLKAKIIQQYIKLLELRNYLTFEERKLIIGIITDMFNDITSNDDFQLTDLIIDEILVGLSKLLSINNEEINRSVIENFLPSVLNRILPDESNLYKYLSILERLIINYQLLEMISIRLTNKLLLKTDMLQGFSFDLLELIIKSIYKIQGNQQFLMNSWFKSFLPHIFRLTESTSTATGSGYNNILEIVSELVGLIVKYTDKSKHQEILYKFSNVFINGESGVEFNLKSSYKLIETPGPMIVVYNKVLASIDKSSTLVGVNEDYVNSIITKIVDLNNLKDEFLKINYLQHLSLIINKFFDNNHFLETRLSELGHENNLVNFEISIWIIKSLIMKLNPIGIKYLNQLLDDLEKNSKLYLQAFNIILKDLKIYNSNKEIPKGTKIISKVNNLNVRLLYKQQIFNTILDKILLNGESENIIYLNLLSILTKNIDSKILKLRINEIIPLIIKSLKVNNLLDSSLDTLLIIIENNDLMDYLPFLVNRLVILATTKITIDGGRVANNERIRYLSLSCLLNLLQKHEQSVIKIYKPEILAGLNKSLDDPKRSVRKLTCDIRQLLFELRD